MTDPASFTDTNLHGARFERCDLSEAVMRAVDIAGADIDAPWLCDGSSALVVNGVDVAPYVEAQLNDRFPGRAGRRPGDPEGLRAAWSAVERAWAGAVERVATMPEGTVEESVDGEWSFAQTLRHLVMATDVWLRKAIVGVAQPFDPIGQPNAEYETDGGDMSVFSNDKPPYAEVLVARVAHQAMVREFLSDVAPEVLAQARQNPWAPEHSETVLSCLQVILEEEWEHLRFASRDLDILATRRSSAAG